MSLMRTGALLIGLAAPACGMAQALVFDVLDQGGWTCQAGKKNAVCIMPGFIDALSNRSGIQIIPEKVPIPRMMDRLRRHDSALTLGVAADTAGVVSLGEGFTIPLIAVTRKGTPPLVRYEDLYHLKGVGFLRGAKYGHRVDKDPLVPRVDVAQTSTALVMLAAGRLDAVVGTALLVAAQAKEENLEGTLGSRLILGHMTFNVMAAQDRVGDPKIQAVAKAVNELRAEGVFEQLLADTVGFSLTQ